MTLVYRKGDILETEAKAIAHGVAVERMEDMKTGLAKQINEKWPQSYKQFKKERRNGFGGGDIIICQNTDPAIVYLATQPDLYHAEMPLVRKSLRNLSRMLEEAKIQSCAVPKIGCGLGKLEWSKVSELFEEYLSNSQILFSVYNDYTK